MPPGMSIAANGLWPLVQTVPNRRNVYGLVGTRRNGQYEWKRIECQQECQLQQMKSIHASERVWTSRNSSERIKQLELFPLK